MFALILAALGQLAELLNRLTTARAGNLDKLDANISTRAASSTAVSNLTLTDARIGFLDKLNVGGMPGTIKSIQTGFVNLATTDGTTDTEDDKYVDVTLTAVGSTAKCICLFQGGHAYTTPTADPQLALYVGSNGSIWSIVTARLTSTTNLRLGTLDGGLGAASVIVGRYYVIEFY